MVFANVCQSTQIMTTKIISTEKQFPALQFHMKINNVDMIKIKNSKSIFVSQNYYNIGNRKCF